MKIHQLSQLNTKETEALYQRPAINFDTVLTSVKQILDEVKTGGDRMLFELNQRFDKAHLTALKVTPAEVEAATAKTKPNVRKAFTQAAANIRKFHRDTMLDPASPQVVETMPGVLCRSELRSIEKVGLYIPGGSAPLASTVLMLAIPAKLAGCQEIILATPPNPDGSIAATVLFAAQLCDITSIYKVGGAQAIAAMAYGTETIPKVDKIFGPGNQYVTAAKMAVSTDTAGAAIDLPAGPTEVLVIADEAARPDFVASDLLAQAEHGEDSQANLVCLSTKKAQAVLSEVEKQLATLPRKNIAQKALKNSFIAIADSLEQAAGFSNRFAPEHLILNTEQPETLAKLVINAGSVFLGAYSPESAGDYASGTNHALPTYGYARAYSGVSVASFQKRITFQSLTPEGARSLEPTVSAMADEEGLEAHKRAMEIRLT